MGSDILKNVLLPFGLLIGIVRTVLIVGLAVVYALFVEGLCRILVSTSQPLPDVYNSPFPGPNTSTV